MLMEVHLWRSRGNVLLHANLHVGSKDPTHVVRLVQKALPAEPLTGT